MLHLYNNRHYRSIQEDIRAMDWFILALTKEYNELPEPLYMILLAMAKKSPTFFDNLVISRTPHELRERFRFMLFPFSFIVGMQENWEVPLLIHQLYAEAIARDMKGGRLVDGFCEPLKEIRQWIAERMKSQQE